MLFASTVVILNLNGLLVLFNLALKVGEKPPDPTVPPPKPASEQEIQNSVELRLANMTKEQVNNSGIYFCINRCARPL